MRKKWDDRGFNELDQTIWRQERKQKGHQKLLVEIDKMEKRTGYKHIFVYATSLTLFLIVIFVGFQFFMNDEQSPAVSLEEELDSIEDNEPEIVLEGKEKLKYFGTIDDEEHMLWAMTDQNVMYFLPMTGKSDIDLIQRINFQYEDLNGSLALQTGLRHARSDIPLKSYEIKNGHLHLYFQKEDLMNLRGSTGSSMGFFTIRTFASNFRDQVTHFTAYGDGEPFYHEGEGFGIIDVPLNTNIVYLPVHLEKGIFLRQYYPSIDTIEEALAEFFSYHEPLMTESAIDLSIISLESVEESGDKTVIRLIGDLEDAYEKNHMDKESLKNLIIHGVGANLREKTELEQAEIYLNKELLFNGVLDHIRINNFDELGQQLLETSIETMLTTNANAILTHLENESWELLMRSVHPEKGLLFSPYAYVEKDKNVTFTREEVAAFATNENKYVFGHHYAKDDSVYENTPKDFIRSILINYEYLNKKVSYKLTTFNQTYQPSGGIINNLSKAFPEGKYVEFFAPPQSEEQEHLWQALRFVFEEREDKRWYLVAIVRDVHSP
ncbi:hypothetical protein H1D32_06015 [Anaerobacillus sp. CMMVII]|uniref:hypothetical protein n=1 Tax=Anaerobacillus sp. CMMVII TaxID=2755588 RepID=UPI0021B7466B|nr:hypothetical protein [Anaerobacillus sp. CMMVII]MCT8137339.1 hypothetical protein [Anaerobacillus sp. CMMVII]